MSRLRLMPTLSVRFTNRRPMASGGVREATEMLPRSYRVVLENPAMRVVEFRARRGSQMPMHSHPAHVIVNLAPSEVRITYPDGRSEVTAYYPGGIYWSEAVEHAGEVLHGNVHMFLIENRPGSRP